MGLDGTSPAEKLPLLCHLSPLRHRRDRQKRGEGISLSSFKKPVLARFCLLAEVAVQQTLKSLAVAGLVAGHLVDGVVDGIQVVLLGQLSQLELAGGRASLRAGERTRSPFVRQR